MKLYEESHSGWTAKPDGMGGYSIKDANGWTLATLHYDYKFTCNATNHFRSGLLTYAPELFEYIKSSASNGCASAQALVDKIERS